MRIEPTPLQDALVIEPRVMGDERGFFQETWTARDFGLHLQNPNPQGKLVRVARGAVFDAIVDLRRSSSTFGKSFGLVLSDANKRMLWVPPGFAHGFLTLEDETDFLYKCTALYDPQSEHSLAWNDATAGIDWPLEGIELSLSAKDRAGLKLTEIPSYP